MSALGKVNSASIPQKVLPKPEIVDFSAVSLFKSRCFKILGPAAVLTASVVWILPTAASLMEVTLNPLLIKPLLGTILVGVALFGLNLRKELFYYDISIVYTIYRGNPWWTKIDEMIILGALPLEHQIDKLIADLKITHVIALIEPFELEPGIVKPAQPDQWEAKGIKHKLIPVRDFKGVPKKEIAETIDYIGTELQKNPNAIFYIHCKAGIGRSTTIVLCYLMSRYPKKFTTKENTFAFIQDKRSQVNLNKNQMLSAQDYLNSPHFKKFKSCRE